MDEKESKNRNIYLWYTALFLLVSLFVFGQLLLYGKTTVWTIDGYMQWYPEFVKFQNFIHNLFSGNGIAFWDWSLGLGSDYLANAAAIVFDPFCYLALFFSKEYVDAAYFLISVVKLYAAGLVAVRYLRYHKKSDVLCLIGGISYAFCGWGLATIRQTLFVTQMIIFPLLVLGVDKVEDRRSPLTLILSVFWSVLQNIYFSYMSALFVAIYIIVKYFTSEKKKTISSFLKKMGLYILYAVIGAVLLAAPVMVSTLYAFLQASTGTGVEIHILPTIKQLLQIVPSFVSQIDAFSNDSVIGMNVLFALMIPAIWMQLKRKKTSAWMFAVTILFFCLPTLQSLTNGFSYASGRWCYVMNFFFMYAAVECLEWKKVWKSAYVKKMVIAILVFFASSLLAYLVFAAVSSLSLMIVMMNLALGGILCFFWRKQYREDRWKILTIIVAFNCALMGYIGYSPQTGIRLDQQMDQGKCFQLYNNNSMRAAQDIEDSEFYRIDSLDYPSDTGEDIPWTHTPANVAQYWNVPTLTEYMSTIDSNYLEWNRLMGNSTGYYRRICLFANASRARMDFLLGVKYFIGTDTLSETKAQYSDYAGYGFEKHMETQGVEVLKSSKNASLGYVYETALSDETFAEYDYLEREQILMQSAVLQTEDLESLRNTARKESSALQFENSRTIPYRLQRKQGEEIFEQGVLEGGALGGKKEFSVQEPTTLTLQLEKEVKNSELYVIFKNLKKTPFSTEELWSLRPEEEKNKVAEDRLWLEHLSKTDYGNFSANVIRDSITRRIVNSEGENQGISGIEDYMLNMGYVEKFDGNITCYFPDEGKYSYDSIELLAVPMKNFEKQAEKLEANRLNVTEKRNNVVKGNVDTKNGGMLYLSILYNMGWKIFVDGQETEKIYRVNTAFTGVEVPAGEHTIELRYCPVGYPFTMVLLAVGVFGLIAISLFFHKRRERH